MRYGQLFCAAAMMFLAVGCSSWSGDSARVIYPNKTPQAVASAPAAEPVQMDVNQSQTMPAPAAGEGTSQPTSQMVIQSTEVVDASGIQVNDRFINVNEILANVDQRLRGIAAGQTEQAFRAKAMNVIQDEIRRQVAETLICQEAENRLDEDQKKRIDEEMNQVLKEMIAQAGGSRSKLERNLASRGGSVDEVLKTHRRMLTIQGYMYLKFNPRIAVTRQMALDYYKQNANDKFASPKKVQSQIIAVLLKGLAMDAGSIPASMPVESVKEMIRNKARVRIQQAQAALEQGKDFSEVAKELSNDPKAAEGGLWPAMPKLTFKDAQMEEIAFELREGEVSGVVETPEGFYIVKCVRIEQGRVISFEEAQLSIASELESLQREKLADEYMNAIVGKATITGSQRLADRAVDQAVQKYMR